MNHKPAGRPQGAWSPTRRQFLSGATVATLLAAHGDLSWALPGSEPGMKRTTEPPRLLDLRLSCSAPLSEMAAFYSDKLGLSVVDESDERLTVRAGLSRLTFVPAAADEGEPFYHFAFNIPQNKILPAHAWQKKRTPIIPPDANLRDPDLPGDVVDFRNWNAHSLFFWDPGGNLVEHIARHDLDNSAAGDFGSDDILYASEIGVIVDDVDAAAEKLKMAFALEQYRGGSDVFRAIGDEHGLLLAMKRGRNLGFGEGKPADVFPLQASVRGPAGASYSLGGMPYEIESSAPGT